MNTFDLDPEARSSPVRRPFRWWMSGSLAVMMAALVTVRSLPEDELEDSASEAHPRALRHSPYGVAETVLRIETAVRQRGQVVLLKLDGEQPVIVLESSLGGTPVVMSRADSRPDMPLALQVRGSTDGGADVLIADADLSESLQALPSSVADEIAALPELLDRALA